jgi:hypothetical protein
MESRRNGLGMSVKMSTCALALTVAFGLAVPSHAQAAPADAKISVEARKHFNAGVALLRDPDGARYEEAYREFKTAYAASPSWKILGNLALTAMKLERDGEAIAAYAEYLSHAKDLDANEREEIERDLNVLRAQAVTITLRSSASAAQISDGRTPVQGQRVHNRYELKEGTLTLKVRPGHHTITASVDGKSPLTWEVDAEPATQHEHLFDFDAAVAATQAAATAAANPATPAAVDRGFGGWVALGLAGACALGAGVTGVLTLQKKNEFDDANDGRAPGQAEDLQGEVKTMGLVTDALVGAAIVSAGIGSYLLLSGPKADDGALELRVAPRLGLHRGGVALEGTF